MRRRAILAIAATAFTVRVVYVLVFMRGYSPTSDAHSYYSLARAVAHGRGFVFTLPFEFEHATAIRPPLYPTVAAAAIRLFGDHVAVAQGVNVLAGTAVCVLGAFVASRIAGERAGLCAGLVLALYPPLIANDVTLLAESLAVLLCLACVLLLLDGRTVLAGIALGLLMLDRASAQFLVVVFGGWVVWRFGWRHALRFAAVALVVVAPWAVRNWVHVGGATVVATNGYNLNAVYSPEARHQHGFIDAYFDPRFAHTRIAATDEIDLDATLQRRSLDELRDHPATIARVAVRGGLAWFELSPGRNTGAERADGRNRPVRDRTLPLFYIVTAAGAFALVRARRSPAAQLLMLAAGYFTIVSVLSISVPRLRSIFDACAAVGAGVALGWLLDRRIEVRRDRPARRTLRGAPTLALLSTALVVIVIAALVWRHTSEDNARASLSSVIAPAAGTMDVVARELAAATWAEALPRVTKAEVDQLRDLVAVLGSRAPEVDGDTRGRVNDALRAVRVATHEVDVISLLGFGEYVAAAREGRDPSVARVERRYEREARPADPALGEWDRAARGANMRNAIDSLGALRAYLSSH